jgi:KUP system potassium uptake protein
VAHLWWQDIHKYLCQELAFKASPFDQCLYVKMMQSSFVFVLLYIDDLLVISTSASELEKVFQHLFNCFKIKRVSTIEHYLGMNVEVSASSIHLSQSSHIIKMLEHFGFDCLKSTPSPYNPSVSIQPACDDSTPCDKQKYQSTIGALMWCARITQPDIMFIVSLLSQHQSSPTMEHWGTVKHVMWYLSGTVQHGITLTGFTTVSLSIYSDSSYADAQQGFASTSGFFSFLGSSPVLWMSKKQPVIAQSSAEAKFIAAAEAVKEGIWLQCLVSSVAEVCNVPMTPLFHLKIDSHACITMIEREGTHHLQTKHIDIWYHFLLAHNRESYSLHWVQSGDNHADICTKSFQKIGVFVLRSDGIVSLQGSVKTSTTSV